MSGLPRRLQRILCLDDFESAAARVLPRPVFGYVSGAAEDNRSMRDNRAVFAEWAFRPRVLVDVSRRATGIELFGTHWAQPFGVAPTGLNSLSAYRGDLVLARAAAQAGIPMIVSGSALMRLEEPIAVNPQAWFQAYLPGEQRDIEALIRRVADAGYRTLVLTLDTPAAANRENNVRTGFTVPLRPTPRLAWDVATRPRWLFGTLLRTLVRDGMPHFENNYAGRGAPVFSRNVLRDFSDRGRLDWDGFARVRQQWSGRLVVKGVLHVADAIRAVEAGADGVIVSNHGGRQLDGAVAPLRVLRDIVRSCPAVPVMMDSGIRRGSDVLTALALGARCVFAGRPFVFAAAVGAQAGVRHAIDLLGAEVSRNMALLGINDLGELDADQHLARVGAGIDP